MATIRMSEKEAIERGIIKPEDAREAKADKVKYIRVPVIERHTKRIYIGPGIWHIATFAIGVFIGLVYGMYHHGLP